MALSTRKIFELWEQREKAKKKISELNEYVTKRDDAIKAELERRGLKAIESAETNQRITYVQNETVVYIEPEIRKLLARSPKGRAVLKRAEKTVLDMKAIAAEAQAGNISPDIIAKASEIKLSSPYLKGNAIEK